MAEDRGQSGRQDNLPDLRGAIVVLEQTGAYRSRWAENLRNAGAEIYIADGKQFKRFRNAFDRRKDDYIDAYYLREFYLSEKHRKYILQGFFLRLITQTVL